MAVALPGLEDLRARVVLYLLGGPLLGVVVDDDDLVDDAGLEEALDHPADRIALRIGHQDDRDCFAVPHRHPVPFARAGLDQAPTATGSASGPCWSDGDRRVFLRDAERPKQLQRATAASASADRMRSCGGRPRRQKRVARLEDRPQDAVVTGQPPHRRLEDPNRRTCSPRRPSGSRSADVARCPAQAPHRRSATTTATFRTRTSPRKTRPDASFQVRPASPCAASFSPTDPARRDRRARRRENRRAPSRQRCEHRRWRVDEADRRRSRSTPGRRIRTAAVDGILVQAARAVLARPDARRRVPASICSAMPFALPRSIKPRIRRHRDSESPRATRRGSAPGPDLIRSESDLRASKPGSRIRFAPASRVSSMPARCRSRRMRRSRSTSRRSRSWRTRSRISVGARPGKRQFGRIGSCCPCAAMLTKCGGGRGRLRSMYSREVLALMRSGGTDRGDPWVRSGGDSIRGRVTRWRELPSKAPASHLVGPHRPA